MLKYVTVTGTLKCLTGLRIGGSSGIVEIGGLDNPIIRDPLTEEPYIPGSSLKGKIRSLLELDQGKISKNGEPCDCGECDICLLFGTSAATETDQGPTRLIFRDCFLKEKSRDQLKKLQEKEGLNLTEVKTEVNINRWKAKPLSGPRQMERVPAGAEFEFRVDLRLLNEADQKNKNKYIELLKRGFDLLQQDALGGSGSRGYGRIYLVDLKFN
jgi:CRISPR-associated protein Csm3